MEMVIKKGGIVYIIYGIYGGVGIVKSKYVEYIYVPGGL